MSRSTAYETYADFKSAMVFANFPRTNRKSLLKKANLTEGTPIAVLKDFTYLDIQALNAAFQSIQSRLPAKPTTAEVTNQKLANDIAQLRDNLQAATSQSWISETTAKHAASVLDTLSRLHYKGGFQMKFNGLIGAMAEDLSHAELLAANSRLVPALAHKGLLEAIDTRNLSYSGTRSKITFEGGNTQPFEYTIRSGSRLADLAFTFTTDGRKKADGYYKISVKSAATDQSGLTHIKAYSPKLGRLMSEVFENNYFGFAFYRLLRYIPLKRIAAVQAYILSRNLKDAFIGSGVGDRSDTITDFVINGRLYSANYIMKQTYDSFAAGLGRGLSVTGQPIHYHITEPDAAIQKWITAVNINRINALQAKIELPIMLKP